MTNTVYHNDKITLPLLLGAMTLVTGAFYAFSGFQLLWLFKGALLSVTVLGGGTVVLNAIQKYKLLKSLAENGIRKLNWLGFFQSFLNRRYPSEHASMDMVVTHLENEHSYDVSNIHVWIELFGGFEVFCKRIK